MSLHEAVCRKRPEVCPNSWFIYLGSALGHCSIKQFMAQRNLLFAWNILCILLFGSLWLLDIFIIKLVSKIEDRKNVTVVVKVIWKKEFYECFHQWQHYWAEWLAA
jgi:hypothetical protein